MPPETLLLIEDDEATREVLTILLESDGWQVDGFDSGEAALEHLHTNTHADAAPQVVLCDLHLPGVHGRELAQRLRSAARGAKLYAISATDEPGGAAGYDRLLQKPFGAEQVRTALRESEEGAEVRWFLAGARDEAPAGGRPATPGGLSPTPQPDLPVLDPGTVSLLEQQMGVRAKELYAFALADAGDRLRRMDEALMRSNLTTFRAEAHALKGSAGMIGARRLSAVAAAAEGFGEDLGGNDGMQLIAEMHRACDEIRLMLESMFPI